MADGINELVGTVDELAVVGGVDELAMADGVVVVVGSVDELAVAGSGCLS